MNPAAVLTPAVRSLSPPQRCCSDVTEHLEVFKTLQQFVITFVVLFRVPRMLCNL